MQWKEKNGHLSLRKKRLSEGHKAKESVRFCRTHIRSGVTLHSRHVKPCHQWWNMYEIKR